MGERRKRGGHLVSKHRFIAAQFEAFFADDLWLTLGAPRQRRWPTRWRSGLGAAGCPPVWPVEANEVFVILPRTADERLKAAGASYYPWSPQHLPTVSSSPTDSVLVRLVTSFATSEGEVDRFRRTRGRALIEPAPAPPLFLSMVNRRGGR